MSLKIEKGFDTENKPFFFIKKGKKIGEKELLKEGWIQANNPNYFIKGKKIAHFNNFLKIWLIE